MWEITISNVSEKSKTLDLLFEKLKKEVSLVKGVIILDAVLDRVRVSLAVPDRTVEYFRSVLADAVAEVVTLEYKFQFLSENIRLPQNDNIANRAFLTALTVFDKQTDKNFIKQKLTLGSELFLDSFFNFRLTELKERWKEICVLVSDNLNLLVLTEGFFDMIRFLIKTIPPECEEIHLLFEPNTISLCNAKLEKQKNIQLEQKNTDESKTALVGELITLSPQKIVVHSEKKESFVESLLSIFDDKIRFVPLPQTQKV